MKRKFQLEIVICKNKTEMSRNRRKRKEKKRKEKKNKQTNKKPYLKF
jgi:hypothetical protein